MFAAFDQGGLHWVFGGSSKILLPEACLLPMTKASFIGSLAEATKNGFYDKIAASLLDRGRERNNLSTKTGTDSTKGKSCRSRGSFF